MNKWICKHPECNNSAIGVGSAIGLTAIGWYFIPGGDILCPAHRPDGITCSDPDGTDYPDGKCPFCKAQSETEKIQSMILSHKPKIMAEYKILEFHISFCSNASYLLSVAIESYNPGDGGSIQWKAYYKEMPILFKGQALGKKAMDGGFTITQDTIQVVAAHGRKHTAEKASEIFPTLSKLYEYGR